MLLLYSNWNHGRSCMRFFQQERCSLCQETSSFLHKIRIGAGKARIKGRICSSCLWN